MNRNTLQCLAASIAIITLLAGAFSTTAQSEKIKQKAKDLKKGVEGGPTQTNKPPQQTPPPPPQKPAK